MERRTRSGDFSVCLLAALAISPAAAQNPLVCSVTASTPRVRAEGRAEPLGDIVLACTGAPGTAINASLLVSLPVTVANRASEDNTLDARLTVDTGSGPVTGATARAASANAVFFNGLVFTTPSSGAVTLRIANIRAAVNELTDASPIAATLAVTGTSFFLNSTRAFIGLPARGLLASYASAGVTCTGSPAPAALDFQGLSAAGTRFFTTRATEGFAASFQKKDASSDTGARILLRYSGFPAGARLFIPDAVAGSSAARPTSAGDFGFAASGGQWSPSSAGSLLLLRVQNPNASGAGGVFSLPAPPPSAFSAVSEVTLAAGAGFAVYEVADSDAARFESALIPTFLTLPGSATSAVAKVDVSFGPISATPVPRFAAIAPAPDCQTVGDCDAAYFPRLAVDTRPLSYVAAAGSPFQVGYVTVNNDRGGLLEWTASIAFLKGAPGWLTISPSSGTNGGTIRADAHPEKLAPGVYEARIDFDGGILAGVQSVPVTLQVNPLPPRPDVVVRSVVNAAGLRPGPVAPGSLATVLGAALAGRDVSAAFDGLPATLLYASDTQINLQVPAGLGLRTSANLVVTADGLSSAPFRVTLAEFAPAIFTNGILNQDGTPNSTANAAPTGSYFQIFATGLISPGGGQASVKLHDRLIEAPAYAGPAPGLRGVDQVNVRIPVDLPSMTTEIQLCQRTVCSFPERITIQARQP